MCAEAKQRMLQKVDQGIKELNELIAEHGPIAGAAVWRMDFKHSDLLLLRKLLQQRRLHGYRDGN